MLSCRQLIPLPLTVLSLSLVLGSLRAEAEPNAYVANTDHHVVSVIDTATDTVLAAIPVGGFPRMKEVWVDLEPHADVPVGGEARGSEDGVAAELLQLFANIGVGKVDDDFVVVHGEEAGVVDPSLVAAVPQRDHQTTVNIAPDALGMRPHLSGPPLIT